MTIYLLPSSSPHTENHRPALLSKQLYRVERFIRLLCRRSKQKLLLVVVLALVSGLSGRSIFFHQPNVANIEDDDRFLTDLIGKVIGANINNETGFSYDSNRARLPPVPWPVESDGCHAEDGTRPYCQFHNFLIDLSRVNSVAIGGESLVLSDNETREVMGQAEEDEYLYYRPGAFQSFTDRNVILQIGQYKPTFAYVNDVLNALRIVDVNDTSPHDWNCTHFFSGTTLFIQRYEYVNLYHTLTDWWNTWTIYRYFQENEMANVPVVFLDAHPAGNLDPVWTTLFGESVHLKRLDKDNLHGTQTAHLCFERAIFVPPGYISLLWPERVPKGGMYDPRATEMMKDFVDFVLDKLKLSHVHKIPGHVVIIDRKPYLAHPRSQLVDDRSLNNLPEVADALLENIPNVTSVRILQLHNMTFLEQVEAVREAEVLVGVHGAGLTHLVFMDDSSHVVEFLMNLDFFVHLAQCKSGQVTLHQIPFISGSVSEAFLNENLLPTFAKIYGLDSGTGSEPSTLTNFVRIKV